MPRPITATGEHLSAPVGVPTTFTSAAGQMIEIEIDCRELGRALELDPTTLAHAMTAFRQATAVRAVRNEALR
jgi:hypothetical protein